MPHNSLLAKDFADTIARKLWWSFEMIGLIFVGADADAEVRSSDENPSAPRRDIFRFPRTGSRNRIRWSDSLAKAGDVLLSFEDVPFCWR